MPKKILILCAVLLLTTNISFAAENKVTIVGKHHIDGIESGTRTYILAEKNGKIVNKTTSPVNTTFSVDIYPKETVEYIFYEEKINSEELEQDQTIYNVQITVTPDSEPVLVLKGPDGKIDELSFTDKYKPKETPEIKPEIPETKTETSMPEIKPKTPQMPSEKDQQESIEQQEPETKIVPTKESSQDNQAKRYIEKVSTGDVKSVFVYALVLALTSALIIVFTKKRKGD